MTWPHKFRKRPVEIEAVQYIYPAPAALKEWLGDSYGSEAKARHPHAKGEMYIKTLEDGSEDQVKHIATEGDWIIKGVHGEFYPCKPDIFRKSYEAVIENGDYW